MDQATPIACLLCHARQVEPFHRDKRRDYWRCRACSLVFVAPEQHLSTAEEKALYDQHQNDPHDQGYRNFLSRLAVPLTQRLASNAKGLDYGCGPGPALAQMLREQGFDIGEYDPLYANRPELLTRRYDFITCTEVVEHFRDPALEFERLFALLEPGGHLGIMSKRVINAEAFARWHYKNDPTHIGFFSIATFEWLAHKYRYRVEFFQQDVAIIRV